MYVVVALVRGRPPLGPLVWLFPRQAAAQGGRPSRRGDEAVAAVVSLSGIRGRRGRWRPGSVCGGGHPPRLAVLFRPLILVLGAHRITSPLFRETPQKH